MSANTNTTAAPFDPYAFLPQAPALDNTYGVGLIGTALGLMLFGLTVHQVYRYFRLYPTDPTYVKVYVIVLLAVETFHIILSLHSCYFYLITNYLQPGAFLIPVWSVNTVPLTTGVVATLSQCFFAHRVWLGETLKTHVHSVHSLRKVGPKYRLFVLVAIVLLLVELGFSLAATIETYVRPLFTSYWNVTWVFSASFGMAVLVDTILTGVLITVLHRSRTGLKRTDSLIDLLIVYAINTGLLTGIFNILTFIFALVYSDNLIYGAFAVVTAKLYANSVLAALNARKSLIPTDGLELDSLGISFAAATTQPENNIDAKVPTGIQVTDSVPGSADGKVASLDTAPTMTNLNMEQREAKGTRFLIQTV
ncbi:hypothetical protein C8Q79DRAFT_475128 [Trametes meyenii]|nr:hypothetical protein C8Q79DRAFT_475128 [Trametes meyenii]